ncbi:MAG: MipA/OmpV family protein [Pseudomonadota bacterium]
MTQSGWAQQPSAQAAPASNASDFIAVGAAQILEYEGADASRIVPFVAGRLPLFGRQLEIDGLQLRYDLLDSPVWRAGPGISATIPRGDTADSNAVALLPSIGVGLELGAYAGFRIPFSAAKEGALSGYLFARRDMASAHDGWLVTADMARAIDRLARKPRC